MGAAWEWASHGCTSSSVIPSPQPLIPVVTPLDNCLSKVLPWPFLTLTKILYSHLYRVFVSIKCFPLQLFTWSSWYPWWGSSDGIITPILQERRLRLSCGFYSVIRDYWWVSASHWSSSAPLAQVPGFLFFSLTFLESQWILHSRLIYMDGWWFVVNQRLESQLCVTLTVSLQTP